MSYIGNQPTSVAFLTDTFSGNGSTTAFTMSVAPATTSSILVSITGVLQDPFTYSVTGVTLTFSAAPPTGTGNISVRYLGIPASGVATTAYRTVTEFTATAGQTTFSVPSYTVGFIDVYRNGVLLGSADYTASNGTTVVLAAGATAGDLVETISFYVSSVLNAIPATAGSVGTSYLVDGSVTTAKIADANVTQAKLSTNIAGTGPAFSAFASATTTIAQGTSVKIAFATEVFDTNNNFASSRFTPTVSGYYQINACITFPNFTNTSTAELLSIIFKNGTAYAYGSGFSVATSTHYIMSNVSTVVYLNGTTDYVEIYGFNSIGSSISVVAENVFTYFSGAMVRSA
jgi:hypothetical protein